MKKRMAMIMGKGLRAFLAVVCGGLILAAGHAWAEGPKISGFIDTTYNWNAEPGVNMLRSYDFPSNTFLFNVAHLAFDGTMESAAAGYHIEIETGSDVVVNTATGNGNDQVQEAYLTWSPVKECTLTVGKFVTLEGIEVIESGANPTISRGYLFGLAEPFNHVGVKMNHKHSETLDFTIGVVNGWDVDTDINRDKTWLGRIGVNMGDPLSFGLVGYYGTESGVVPATGLLVTRRAPQSSLDLVGVSKWGNLALNFQVNYGEQKASAVDPISTTKANWSGFGIQPVYTLSDKTSIGARYEYFDDKNGARTGLAAGTNPSVYNLTVTPTWKISDPVTLRAEYRYDKANKKIFAGGSGKDASSTISTEMIYTF